MEWPHSTLISPRQNRESLRVFQVRCLAKIQPLFRTKGFSGASGEATARCVNLYEDMGAAC